MGGKRTLAQVLEGYPELTIRGFHTPVWARSFNRELTREAYAAEFAGARQDLANRPAGRMQAIIGWLEDIPATKLIYRYPSSYGLKHICEKALGHYVANGEFIAAALMAGFRAKRSSDPAYPNCFFNMSQKAIRLKGRAVGMGV